MRRLAYLLLGFLALGAAMVWLAGRDASLQWALDRVSRASQGKLQFEGVRGSLLGTIDVDRAHFSSPELEIRITRGSLQFSLFPLLRGDLIIDRVAADTVTLRQTPTGKPSQAPQDLTLPLAIQVKALEVKEFSFESGALNLSVARLRGQFSSDGKQHEIVLDHLESPWGTASASLSLGGLAPFALTGKTQFKPLQPAWLPMTRIAFSGNLLEFRANLDAHTASLSVKAAAQLRPFDPAVVPDLTADIERIDLRSLDPTLPRAELKGSIRAHMGADNALTGDVRLRNAQAGPLSTDQLPFSEARFHFRTDFQQLRLSHLDLKLVRGSSLAGEAVLAADGITAQLTTSGLDLSAFHARLKPTRLAGNLALDLHRTRQRINARLADRHYHYEADVTRRGDRLEVRKAQVRANSGSITAQGYFETTRTYPFKGHVEFSQLDPAAFGDFPSAQLNGTADVNGWINPNWQADVKLALKNSSWRNQPLSGRVETSLSEARLWNSHGEIFLGRNQLDFRGALGMPEDQLDVEFKLSSLEQVIDQWQVSLQGRARLQGKWRYPSLDIDVTGEKLRGPQQIRLDTLQLRAAVEPALDAPLRIDAQLKGIAFAGMTSDSLLLQVAGTNRDHQAQLSIDGERLALHAQLNGGLQNLVGWSGRIARLDMTRPHPVKLEAPATLAVSKTGLDIGAARLTSDGARLEMTQLTIAPGVLRTQGRFTGLPLALLNLLPANWGIETSLLLGGEWSIDAAQTLNGFLRVHRESGDILMVGENAIEEQLTEARLSVVADNNHLHIESNATARRGGFVRAQLDVLAAKDDSGWVVQADAPIVLNADANLLYMDWLGPFIHPSLLTNGKLHASASGRGTWGAPILEGRIEGSDLAISEAGSGVRLTKGTLTAHFSDEQLVLDDFIIHGKQGSLGATGRASFRGEPKLALTFQSRQLGLLDRPGWDVNADTDGTLTADRLGARLAARIKVNHAKIGIPERRAAVLSQDVVIKGPADYAIKKGPSNVALDLLVDLGSDFRVRTIISGAALKQVLSVYQNRLDARLGGSLQIRNESTGALSAKGKIHVVDGIYTFLGRQLEIKRGTFQFDGPVDNPALDILAMNEQFQVKVGVSITGTALNPHTQLVSDPVVSEQEKLSWLLFGRGGQSPDYARSSGGASTLTSLGMQVSETVYVGYEQGSVGTSNIMTIYTKLTKRLTAEARTGDTSSLRLFYTFELD